MNFIEKFGTKIVGILAVVVGLLGLALPVLPGWVLIFVGLELLGFNLIFWQKIKAYISEKTKKNK